MLFMPSKQLPIETSTKATGDQSNLDWDILRNTLKGKTEFYKTHFFTVSFFWSHYCVLNIKHTIHTIAENTGGKKNKKPYLSPKNLPHKINIIIKIIKITTNKCSTWHFIACVSNNHTKSNRDYCLKWTQTHLLLYPFGLGTTKLKLIKAFKTLVTEFKLFC